MDKTKRTKEPASGSSNKNSGKILAGNSAHVDYCLVCFARKRLAVCYQYTREDVEGPHIPSGPFCNDCGLDHDKNHEHLIEDEYIAYSQTDDGAATIIASKATAEMMPSSKKKKAIKRRPRSSRQLL